MCSVFFILVKRKKFSWLHDNRQLITSVKQSIKVSIGNCAKSMRKNELGIDISFFSQYHADAFPFSYSELLRQFRQLCFSITKSYQIQLKKNLFTTLSMCNNLIKFTLCWGCGGYQSSISHHHHTFIFIYDKVKSVHIIHSYSVIYHCLKREGLFCTPQLHFSG